jgi:hypothetical protein
MDNGVSTLAYSFIHVNPDDEQLVLRTLLQGFKPEMIKQFARFSFLDVQMKNIDSFDLHKTHLIADHAAEQLPTFKNNIVIVLISGVECNIDDEVKTGPALLIGLINDYSYSVGFDTNKIETIRFITELHNAVLAVDDVCFVKNNSTSKLLKAQWETFVSVVDYDCSYRDTIKFTEGLKQFVAEVYNAENDVTRMEQLAFLKESKIALEESVERELDLTDFAEAVLPDADAKDEFVDFMASLGCVPVVNEHALKSKQTMFKSILKLDKNFHIYIHGARELMERGYDEECRMHYYKLYFNTES